MQLSSGPLPGEPMTINRAFISSLSISSDGLTGTAIVEADLPLSTRLALTGQIKEAGERKWIEIECNIISRGGNARRKKRRHFSEKGTSA